MSLYATVKELRVNASEILRNLKEKEDKIIITKRGHPIALLLSVEENNIDVFSDMIERVKLQLTVREICNEAKKRNTDKRSSKDIDAIIKKARIEKKN